MPGRNTQDDSTTTREVSYLIAQANLQRKELATNEVMIEASRRKIAVALLQEPYVGGAKSMKDYGGVRVFQSTCQGDGTVKAAIVVYDHELDVIQYPCLSTNNIVVVKIKTCAWEIIAISFYFEPDQPIEPYLDHLKKIQQELSPKKLIVGGDANAKNTWWGSNKVDHRGEDLSGVLEEMCLQVLNDGDIPTFDTVRGGRRITSNVDLTACSEDLLNLVEDWRVVEDLTSADHNGMTFRIRLQKAKGVSISRTTRKYNTKKVNWNQFHEKLSQLKMESKLDIAEIESIQERVELDKFVERHTQAITKTCEATIAVKKQNQKLTMPWWSDELEKMKHDVATRKRRVRCAAPIRRARVVSEYLQSKEKYECEAKKAQVESWKQFCGRQDKEGLWEGIYRVIRRTERRQEDLPLVRDGRQMDQCESARVLAETFFPEDIVAEDNSDHRRIRERANQVNGYVHDEEHDAAFTLEELRAAMVSFNPKKAPGIDGFTADICSQVVFGDLEMHLALMNKCHQLDHFPTSWKEAAVVALRKPGKKDYTSPKSYRPIGLLPILGKVLEKMMIGRLKWHLLPRLNIRQYGFMPQKSTEDSLYDLIGYIRGKLDCKKLVTVVSLDIEGAFDSAWWPAIRVRLAEEECPIKVRRMIDSYLNERRVRVRYAGQECVMSTQKGCVQGSIGGPILWNLLLDPLLTELGRQKYYCQAFADDVLLVFDGETALEVQSRANDALAYVHLWGVKNKLKFAPHKTNAMVMTRKLKFDIPRLSMGGAVIGMTDEIKVLGLIIDRKLTFNSHTANICRRALNVYKQLSRAAKISWGLHPEVIRVIYMATVEPIVSYAACAWAPATRKLGVQRQLNAVQRGFAQKLSGAYRTVSLNSALLLAGILPLDIRIREAAVLYEAKRGVPQTVLKDREVEGKLAYTEIPHPAKHMRWEFVSLVNQEDIDLNVNQAVQIYTDGSKIEGKVGAALSLWSDSAEIKALKLKLPSYCTVYQAELLAICRATEIILQRGEASFAILSDSRAALETVVNPLSLHPLAAEARGNMQSGKLQDKEISLFWIKAHAGLEGNERADQLAKEAALYSKKKPDYEACPVSFVKRQIRVDSLDEWNMRYQSAGTAAVTKLFFPDAIQAHRIVKQLRPHNVLTQVMTGHGGFSEYLNRFKCKESPSCICEPDQKESVPHILFECPVFALDRFNVEQLLDCKVTAESIHELISGKYSRKELVEYLVKIAKKVIERNKTDR